jgi:hypothetical protein
MFLIRREQMAALAAASRERFKAEVIDHLRKHFPRLCAAMGDERVCHTVGDGFERAFAYGIRMERDLCRFVELMFVYGERFDETLPWAGEILRKRSIDPAARLDLIGATAEKLREGSNGR